MKTGGFSRFARKPGAKDSASGISHVGGNSETLTDPHIQPDSNNEAGTWGSSDFGSGFGFDAGLEETSFGGEIQNNTFPMPVSTAKSGDTLQKKPLFGALVTIKSPPTSMIDNGRFLGGVPACGTLPKNPVASMSPPPSKMCDPSYASAIHESVGVSPLITPTFLTKKAESRVETCGVATKRGSAADSFQQPRSPFHASNGSARANPRRVTLGGGDNFQDCESLKSSSSQTTIPDAKVIQKQGAVLASPQEKLHGATSAHSQGDFVRTIIPTDISKDESMDVLIKTSENIMSMEGVTVESDLVDSAVDSFEEMFQSIMSQNLQFEDGWKNFEDKILDLSAYLSMRHGDILEMEQSALHLKREMGLKFEMLLSQVE